VAQGALAWCLGALAGERMRRLLAVVGIVAALVLGTTPALAEQIDGYAFVGQCILTPETIKRVDRDDNKARWVQVFGLLRCGAEYRRGRATVAISGHSQGTTGTWADRDRETVHFDQPVTTGAHEISLRMQCNVFKHHKWEHGRSMIRVWIYAQVLGHKGHLLHGAVFDRETSVTC